MRIRIVLAALAALFLVVLCGCQPTPESAVVTSKNDGALEAALTETAEMPADETVPYQAGEIYTGSFTNTDGDITFNVSLEVPAAAAPLPVLRVRPKTITAETAKHVAEVLFGDADIYDYSKKPTKAEIEQKILNLRRELADEDALEEFYGPIKDFMVEQAERAIAVYEAEYDSAPETAEKTPCAWAFHSPDWYYDWALTDPNDPQIISDKKTLQIVAAAERDELPYIYTVTNRNEEDYRTHSITCEIDYWQAQEDGKKDLYYITQKPTEEDVAARRAEAEAMLGAMDLGEWVIESCVVARNSYSSAYTVIVRATPVYNGVKVTRQKQMDLRSGDAYAANYYYGEAVFTFCGSRLESFEYQSPLEVVEVVNDNVAYLSFAEAMEICEKQLRMSLLTSYPYARSDFMRYADNDPITSALDEFSRTVRKDVNVYQVELGLVRTRVKDSFTDFYLLPAYTFRASFVLYDQDGRVVADSEQMDPTGSFTRALLVVNALDGSVIDTELGY